LGEGAVTAAEGFAVAAEAFTAGVSGTFAARVSEAFAAGVFGTFTAGVLGTFTDEQDGKKTDLFGPNPQGQETRAANGHVSVIIARSDLPKFVSNNRPAGTPEENKAVVQGSIAYFGMSSVNETDIVYCLLGYI
jgi:hypothetical protein